MRIRTNTNTTITCTSSIKNTLRRILIIRNRSNFLDYEGNILWFYTVLKKYHHYTFLKINDVIKEFLSFIRIKYISWIHFHEEHISGIPQSMWIRNSHNVVQLNPDENKYYLLTPYPTLMQSLKKFSPESIRAIARNPNIDLQSIGIYSKSDIQHHIRTQQFQELLTQMDTIQRQSIDQNLRKLCRNRRICRYLHARL